MKRNVSRWSFGLISAVTILSLVISPSVGAVVDLEFYQSNRILFQNEEFETGACSTSAPAISTGAATGGTNKDYKGEEILSSAQLAEIKLNQPIYEQAAKAASIPWQMVATIHLRETGLKKFNPGNGQGIYQDYARINGPYPPGPVSDADFLRQTTWAANFLKNKATKPELLATADAGQVKDAFFGYNGRASVYKTQAASLGFTEAYEGSPYVMNKADAKRDPTSNPTGWGQIKSDGGGIRYPANGDHGSYVIYASLAGIAGGGGCAEAGALTGDTRSKIVTLAQAELALWENGTLKPGGDFKKYTYGTSDDWCAWFVSWILKEAGAPVNSNPEPFWSFVSQFATQGPSEKGYKVYPNDGSYTPKPGDFALYGNAHINIVVGLEGSAIKTIGGNQGSTDHTASKVTTATGYANHAATRWVSID